MAAWPTGVLRARTSTRQILSCTQTVFVTETTLFTHCVSQQVLTSYRKVDEFKALVDDSVFARGAGPFTLFRLGERTLGTWQGVY